MSSSPLTKGNEVGGALLELCLCSVTKIAAGRNDGALECLAERFQVLLVQDLEILDLSVACSKDDAILRPTVPPLRRRVGKGGEG